jgi:uncharacterized OB-fold protein
MTIELPVEATTPVRIWGCADCRRTFVAEGERCPLCGLPTEEVTAGGGRGRLTSWTTIHTAPQGGDPYVIGWAELVGIGQGILGRFVGDASVLRRGLPLLVRQTGGGDGWPRVWLEPDDAP